MILDGNLQFSSQQAITTTADSTNIIDLANAGDLGAGEDIRVAVVVTAAFTAAGAATMQISLVGSATSNFATPIVIDNTDVIAKATLAIGARIEMNIPREIQGGGLAAYRYLKLTFTVATGPMTAGAVTANIVKDNQDNRPYPANFSS